MLVTPRAEVAESATSPAPPPPFRCAAACTQRHSIADKSSIHVSLSRVRESAKPPNTNILSPSTAVAVCFHRAGGRSPTAGGTLNFTLSPRNSSAYSASEGPGGLRWLSPPNMYSVVPLPTAVSECPLRTPPTHSDHGEGTLVAAR